MKYLFMWYINIILYIIVSNPDQISRLARIGIHSHYHSNFCSGIICEHYSWQKNKIHLFGVELNAYLFIFKGFQNFKKILTVDVR